ncbi:MAG: sterol carrier protein domain-containing protein [Candidatus Dormibacteria bacterium]
MVLDVQDLAAIYLSGACPSALARAGRLDEEVTGTLQLADAAFMVSRAPWCDRVF